MTRARPVLCVLVLMLLFGTSATVRAQTPEPAFFLTVEGQITNGTPGGTVPPDLPIMIHTLSDRTVVDTVEGTTDTAGYFRFENVIATPGSSFEVMVTYRDVAYGSERITPQAGQTRLNLPVTIYETTTNQQAVRVGRQLLLLNAVATPGMVGITHIYLLSNSGNRTVVAEGNNGLRFHLPAGATNVTFEHGPENDRFITLTDSFVDTGAVRPGNLRQTIIVSYALPYEDAIEFTVPVDYPTDQTIVLLPKGSARPESPVWKANEELSFQGQIYQGYRYTDGPLVPGKPLQLVVIGWSSEGAGAGGIAARTESALPAADDRSTTLFVGLALALTLVTTGSILWWSQRQRETGLATAANGSERLVSLLLTIARLDDAYEAGAIEGAEYQARRSHLCDRAVELMEKSTE